MKAVVTILTLIVFGCIAVVALKISQADDRINNLYAVKQDLIKTDSLRDSIEARIMDSIKVELAIRDKAIQKLKSDLTKMRQQNEQLEKLYRSLPDVTLPDFGATLPGFPSGITITHPLLVAHKGQR